MLRVDYLVDLLGNEMVCRSVGLTENVEDAALVAKMVGKSAVG